MITSALAGFATSMGLIAAIGAQNAFVLRQGLRREHVWPVVLTCAASDALLISVGVAGLGAAVARQPAALTAVRWGGAAFLLCYAALAFRRALRPGSLVPTKGPPTALRATILACLAFTYLNPHVYLDTVLLLGSVANQYRHQWAFGGRRRAGERGLVHRRRRRSPPTRSAAGPTDLLAGAGRGDRSADGGARRIAADRLSDHWGRGGPARGWSWLRCRGAS